MNVGLVASDSQNFVSGASVTHQPPLPLSPIQDILAVSGSGAAVASERQGDHALGPHDMPLEHCSPIVADEAA